MASLPPPPSPLDKDPSLLRPAASPALAKDPSFRAGSAELCTPAFKSRPRGRTAEDSEALLRRQFRLLVRKCTSKKHSKRGHYYAFTYNDVVAVIKAVKKVLIKEPPLIEMKVPCAVIGDLHGQYTDLCRIFDMFRDDKTPGYAMTRYVFLGDYVDRGRQSLEIVMILFMLKYLYPTQFALLRGNHECRAINKAYGFFAEIKERFLDPKKAVELFEMFNECFTHLPLACLVAGNILCMHGGISSKIKTRDDIMKVPKPIKDVATNQIATDLLWADPMEGLPGEIPNKVRGVSVYFGEATLDQFLVDLKVKLVIRGHQMMMNGFNFFHNKLITVFSAAAYYPDKPNRGAVCTIDASGRVGFQVVIPNKDNHPDDKPKLFRGDHDVAN
ncbi:hypothetical protein PRIPAC_76189, partial [Pristionchus pacificus]|uniref:Serine/threonine-protein phosphatase n=1 Tax=Pristionchus pacificus TaxID=54126 RepID=A0A2A6B4P9_PRIPA